MARIISVFTCILFLSCYEVECFSNTPIKCANGRQIAESYRCNGHNDCGDFSDERNCEPLPGSQKTPKECTSNEFRCANGKCIPLENFCDGVIECMDISDELPDCFEKKTCSATEFRCSDRCIDNAWVCDGEADCPDKSDELSCQYHSAETCTLSSGFFSCKTGRCIPLNLTCNTVDDCGDGSDESPHLCLESQQQCTTTKKCSQSCQPTPNGAVCTCPPGYLMNDDTCSDIDECQNPHLCDHRCDNIPGSYTCSCAAGYDLQPDGHTCKVPRSSGDASLAFPTAEELRVLTFSTVERYSPLQTQMDDPVPLTMTATSHYWAQLDTITGQSTIWRRVDNDPERKIFLTAGLGKPETIAVDRITTNVYFTDSTYNRIGVCTESGAHCTIIIANTVAPKGLALDPVLGQLYWSGWGDHPHISKAHMTGRSRSALVSDNLARPQSLTIDHPNARLYWVDAKLQTIESISLDGNNRRQVPLKTGAHPSAIAVFEDRLFWSDPTARTIQSCNKFTGKDRKTLLQDVNNVSSIHIDHLALTPKHSNPCKSRPCAELCLLSLSSSYVCVCSSGKAQMRNGRCLMPKNATNQLLISGGRQFFHYLHNKLGRPEKQYLLHNIEFLGGAYDPISGTGYAIDADSQGLHDFDLQTKQFDLLLSFHFRIAALGFDHFGNNFYVSSKTYKAIVIFREVDDRWIQYRIPFSEEPSTLLLIPELGLMCVTFCKATDCHIDVMQMDGKDQRRIVSGLEGPRISLAFDARTRKVFWADEALETRQGQIGSASLTGAGNEIHQSGLDRPVSVAVLGDELFWTIHDRRVVFWAPISGGDRKVRSYPLDFAWNVKELHLIPVNNPPPPPLHPCRAANPCSHVCVVRSPETYVCKCPLKQVLALDQKTCISETNCTSNEAKCSDGACIATSRICDGFVDCENGEDEKSCPQRYCGADSFSCRDSSGCVSRAKLCKDVAQCADASDEEYCSDRVCNVGAFKCSSGRCIPAAWRCDGEADCSDGSDEGDICPTQPCPKSMFKCKNRRCLDSQLTCNEIDDCGDNSDEEQCIKSAKSPGRCTVTKFQFAGVDYCLPTDKADSLETKDVNLPAVSCAPGQFTCDNSKCVGKTKRCNRHDDCGDNSDEKECLNDYSRSPEELYAACREFKCKLTGVCISWQDVCNGVGDCLGGSDEGFHCADSCDGNPCQHICRRTPGGPVCECRAGFKLSEDRRTCLDVDECKEGACTQRCVNSIGSYHCGCFQGYALRPDGSTCKAIEGRMELITATRDDIRRISATLKSVQVIRREPMGITGLDLDTRASVLYWSSEVLGTIHQLNLKTHREKVMKVGGPRVLAVDWFTSNVYVFDTLAPWAIKVCDFKNLRCSSIANVTERVMAIAVEPKGEFLFWSQTRYDEWELPKSDIWRSSLSGGDSRIILKDLGLVAGITIDVERKILYWVDNGVQRVERANYDGTRREIFKRGVRDAVGLNLFQDDVYWVRGNSGVIQKCMMTRYKCEDWEVMAGNVETGFAISHMSRQPEERNVCEKLWCGHVCVRIEGVPHCIAHNGSIEGYATSLKCNSIHKRQLLRRKREAEKADAEKADAEKAVAERSYAIGWWIGVAAVAIVAVFCMPTRYLNRRLRMRISPERVPLIGQDRGRDNERCITTSDSECSNYSSSGDREFPV